MKKLTWLFLSLMLVLGTGTAFAQGDGETTTVPQPTFSPDEGAVAVGTQVTISGESEGYPTSYKIAYVIDDEDFDFTQYMGSNDVPYTKMYTDPIVINTAKKITAAIYKYDEENEEVLGWSAKVTATYTIKETETPGNEIPEPTFTTATGTVAKGTIVEIEAPENPESRWDTYTYAVYRVLNNENFDFSQYLGDDKLVKQAGASSVLCYRVTSTITITAATAKINDGNIVGWSEKVSATYTVEGDPITVPAPVFNPNNGVVAQGGKILLTNGTESDATPKQIYYNTKATGSEEFDKVLSKARLESALQANLTGAKLMLYPAEGISITKSPTTINAATAEIDANDSVIWSPVVIKDFTIGEAPTPEEKPAAPVFSPDGGDVQRGNAITLTSTSTGSAYDIYYSFSSSDDVFNVATSFDLGARESAGTLIIYTGGIVLENDATIKAAVVRTNDDETLTWSDIVTKPFTLVGEAPITVATPVITPANDAVVHIGDMVTIECATDGAEIYYTTDGSEPYTTDDQGEEITGLKENTPRYTGPFALTQEMLIRQGTVWAIKIRAVAKNGDAIKVAGAGYVVYPNNPKIGVASGAVEAGTKVGISCVPDSADIYYTTDGSTPTMEEGTLYTDSIVITTATTLKALAVLGQYQSSVVTATYTIDNTVKKPTFTPAAGEVEKGTMVTIECATDNAKIYYSIDADTVTVNSLEYTAAISIDSAMTIKAIAVKEGMENSQIAEAAYTIKKEKDTLPMPKFNPVGGEVEKGTAVVLSCDTADAKIYYSINADTVTVNSLEYTAAISIDSNMTIKAIAVKDGFVNSKVAEAVYTIKEETANYSAEELQGVSIYPNPNNGMFYIELPVDAMVEVFATSGALCQRMNVAAGKTTLTINQSGIFFVRITGEGRTTVKRVIVR